MLKEQVNGVRRNGEGLNKSTERWLRLSRKIGVSDRKREKK